MRLRLPAIVLIVTGAMCVLSAAPQQVRFSSRTTGVRVDVLVMQGNAPVAGLTKADFEVRDNGVVQSVDAVESNDVPINVVLALDTSGSTEGKRLTDLIDAGRALLGGLKREDRAALTTFNQAVAPQVALTADVAAVRSSLDNITAAGPTSLLDGAYVALMTTMPEPGRSLVVICTDGQDTASYLQIDEVTDAAKRSNAVVYAVASGGARRGPYLKELTELTGGHLIEAADSGDYKSQLQRVLTEFRSRYVLSFTPAGVAAGGFHRLDVKVKRGGTTVKARQGYISVG